MSPPTAFNKARALEEATRLVSQRKISQAIKHYLAISDHDPSDLSLLNTIGDLCIRDGNTAEAIKQFQKLADAYTQEGFLLKAVAIRKKISKLAPSDVEPLLKLAEHYSTLGLGREAREHYLQAVALCEKQALTHKALDILRKLVKQEPENLAYRVRLGESCVAVGQNGPAALIYAEIAEIAYKRGELAAVDQPLQRARQLDPSNVQATLLSVRLALDSHQADRAKDILQSSSALKSNPEAVRLLLDVHLLEGKFDDATRVVTRAFREGNDSVGILMHYVQACLSASGPDAALKPLREIAAEAFERNLVETIRHPLRLISEKYPDHLPTLELLVQIAERIPGGEDLLKAVELLSNAYVRASRKDQAENLYRQLLSRDPENNLWQARLNGILQTGMEPQEATSTEAPQPEMTKPEEEPENPHVEEALENASIFARYGLIDKALDELDRALQSEPENFKLLRQTFEVSKQDRPGRAAQAAEAIAALLRKRGDLEAAAEFEELRREVQASAAAELPSQSTSSSQPGGVPPHLDSPAGPTEERFDLEGQPAVMGITPQIRSAPPGPQIVSSIPVSSSASSRTSVSQIDLTEEVEALASITAGQVEEEIIAAPDVFAEERAEIDFYLEYGFFVEARQAAGALAEKFPTHPGLADLQKRVDEATQSIPLTPEETVEPGAGASPAAASEEDLAAVLPAQDAAQDLTEEPQLTPEVPIVEGPAFAITPVPGEPVGEAEPEFAQEPGNWISGRFEESQPDAAEIVVAEEPAHPLDFEWSSMEAISAEEPAQVAEPVPSEPTLVEEVLVAHEIVSRAPAPPPVEEFPPAPDVIAAVPEPSPVEEPLPTAEAVPSIA
ncbi:MAG: tetratricopeptide repeat protein, partial [Terriglobia bacterium]